MAHNRVQNEPDRQRSRNVNHMSSGYGYGHDYGNQQGPAGFNNPNPLQAPFHIQPPTDRAGHHNHLSGTSGFGNIPQQSEVPGYHQNPPLEFYYPGGPPDFQDSPPASHLSQAEIDLRTHIALVRLAASINPQVNDEMVSAFLKPKVSEADLARAYANPPSPANQPAEPPQQPVRMAPYPEVLKKLDAEAELHNDITTVKEDEEEDRASKEDAYRKLKEHIRDRMPYVQLASNRLQAITGTRNELPFELPSLKYRAPILTGDSLHKMGMDSGLTGLQNPPLNFEVDSVTGRGLREYLTHKIGEVGCYRRTCKSISFHDATPDIRTGTHRNELVQHYTVNGSSDRIEFYEIELPTEVVDERGVVSTISVKWAWFLIQKPIIASEHTNLSTVPEDVILNRPLVQCPTQPPDFPSTSRDIWVIFAAPMSQIHCHPSIVDSTIPDPSRLSNIRGFSARRVRHHRQDIDLSFNGVPIFEFSSSGFFHNNADAQGQNFGFMQIQDMGRFVPGDRYGEVDQETWEARCQAFAERGGVEWTKGSAIAGAGPAPNLGKWWEVFYDKMWEDVGKWMRIRQAMAVGQLRLVIRWDEGGDDEAMLPKQERAWIPALRNRLSLRKLGSKNASGAREGDASDDHPSTASSSVAANTSTIGTAPAPPPGFGPALPQPNATLASMKLTAAQAASKLISMGVSRSDLVALMRSGMYSTSILHLLDLGFTTAQMRANDYNGLDAASVKLLKMGCTQQEIRDACFGGHTPATVLYLLEKEDHKIEDLLPQGHPKVRIYGKEHLGGSAHSKVMQRSMAEGNELRKWGMKDAEVKMMSDNGYSTADVIAMLNQGLTSDQCVALAAAKGKGKRTVKGKMGKKVAKKVEMETEVEQDDTPRASAQSSSRAADTSTLSKEELSVRLGGAYGLGLTDSFQGGRGFPGDDMGGDTQMGGVDIIPGASGADMGMDMSMRGGGVRLDADLGPGAMRGFEAQAGAGAEAGGEQEQELEEEEEDTPKPKKGKGKKKKKGRKH